MDVAGKVALVTGGASGLGRAVVEELAVNGAAVVICDLPTSPGESVAREFGNRVRFMPTDVTSEPDVEAAISAAGELGGLHIAVNCAGIGTPGRVLGRKGPHPLDQFASVIRVNLVGTFNVIRLAASQMSGNEPGPDGEKGVIVNTASVAAFDGQIGQASYSA